MAKFTAVFDGPLNSVVSIDSQKNSVTNAQFYQWYNKTLVLLMHNFTNATIKNTSVTNAHFTNAIIY